MVAISKRKKPANQAGRGKKHKVKNRNCRSADNGGSEATASPVTEPLAGPVAGPLAGPISGQPQKYQEEDLITAIPSGQHQVNENHADKNQNRYREQATPTGSRKNGHDGNNRNNRLVIQTNQGRALETLCTCHECGESFSGKSPTMRFCKVQCYIANQARDK